MTYFGIGGKLLGPVYQPEVKPILRRTQIAGQFRVVALGIVDEVSGVYFEKRASSMRDELVRCGRAPLSIWDR